MVKQDLLTRCKGIPVFRYVLSSFLLLFFFNHQIHAQVALACNGQTNVSVGATCNIDAAEMLILTGTNDSIAFKISSTNLYLQSGTMLNGSALSLGVNPRNITSITANVGKLLIGKTHVYELYNNGNRCWGNILIEDKLAPTVTCQPNITVECADALAYYNADIKSASILRRPTATDNCGFIDSVLVIEDRKKNCGGFIARHWTYTDCGNVKSSCTDTIFLTPLSPTRVMCPDPYVIIPCSASTSPDDVYNLVFARPIPPGAGLATAQDTLIYKDTTALKAAYPFFKTNGAATFDPLVTLIANKKKGKLDAVCSFITTFTDQYLYPCGSQCSSSKKTIRSWLIMDWCTGVVTPCLQIIEATNSDGPTIKAEDLVVSVDPWACVSNFSFPPPHILHDPCDPNPTYTVRGPLGVVIRWDPSSNRWMAIGAPKGIHEFIYVGKDCCKNEGYDTVMVTVLDRTPPIAVAKLNIIISLTTAGEGNGIAKLFANSVDNGSYDSCTPVHLEIRREDDPTRDNDGCNETGNKTYNDDGHPNDGSKDPVSPNYDTDGGAFVKFCCDDITNREADIPFGMVKVWMRVWDDGNSSGKYGDTINGLTDNYNETWINVRVEDKLTPKIVCPADVTINCDEQPNNWSVLPRARAYSNCVELPVDYRDADGTNSCGGGTILRTWFIRNNPSITCVQRIYKTSSTGVFGINNITWPRDTTTNCMSVDAGRPTFVKGTCDQIGTSLKSDTFYFEGNACMKILNRWTVINWCDYDPQSTAATPPGIWYHTQVIKVLDNEKPTLGSCDPKTYDLTGPNCEMTNLVLTQTAVDVGQCASSGLKWIVFVDLWGDGTTDLEYSSFLPSGDNNINNDTNGNGFNDIYVAPTGNGQTVSITIPSVTGSMSSHKVYWRVVDGCGNVTSCNQNFMVVDKKKPTPYCLNISSALMNNGQVELWAVDFNVGSSDNCTSKSNLLYTFEEANPVLTKLNEVHFFKGAGLNATEAEYNAGTAQKWLPSSKSSGKVFGCSSLPAVDVRMTVWDEKLNFESCTVRLSLADNQGACGNLQTTVVAGRMAASSGEGVSNSEVVLDNGVAEMLKTVTTNATGDFNFSNAVKGYDYSISGRKTDDYTNGVSTLDLVMIQRHILGIEKLSGPYNVIAADINADTKITAADLTELRKLILGVYTSLPNSDSWKFIDKNQTFIEAENPWPLTEKIRINGLSKETLGQNFVAVKVGDVNASAQANANSNITEVRTNTELTATNTTVSAHELHMLTFDANANNVHGMQFTLTLIKADLVDVYVAGQKINDANIAKVDDNKYTISWNDINGVSGKELLTFAIKARENSLVSDLVSINSSVTSSEIYTGDDLKTNKLSLRFGGVENGAEFILMQNEPNPFNDKTVISFNLPKAGDATLKVFDVTGQVIYTNKGSFGKGINSFTLSKTDLPSTGVMIYQLESGANVATKKMIGLE